MKKTRSLMLLIASLFALSVSAQGIVVHQGNSKQVSFKSKDVQKIEFTENQVENSTDNYVEKSELDDRIDKLRDELYKKIDAIEAEKLWTEINGILESIKELYNIKTNKNDIDNAIAQARKEWEALTQENGKGITNNGNEISSLSNDVAGKASQSALNKALDKMDELSKLVKEVQEKIDGGGGSDDSGMNNGHKYVDLGLSVKWATMNVGATEVAGSKINSHTGQLDCYGEYYAWGETSPKDSYNWASYTLCNGSYSSMTKYCISSSYGTVDNKTTLELSDDAARVNWGGSWRMPTQAELDELRTQCTWTWTTLNGVNGYKVSACNGNSIFLPAASSRDDNSFIDVGSYGLYWSSSLYDNDSYCYCACYLFFSSSSVNSNISTRTEGRSVRPVCP